MDHPHDEEVGRISSMSQKLILQTRESCVDGAAHIAASREVIARSLRLLSRRYDRFRDD